MNSEKLPVSLVIITLNEEKNIARCIQSVPWAKEIIVLDSGSQDQTVVLAEKLGARVVTQKFLGFRDQKQKGTDLATQEWILSLDADEAVSAELSKEIQNLFTHSPATLAHGYLIPRKSFHLGQWILHGGWSPDYQLRLFQKKKAHWGGGHVHEHVVCEQRQKLKFPLQHWVFQSLSHQVQANNTYSSLGAQDLKAKSKKFNTFKLIFKPLSKFVETYFIKKGFLDGMAGFVISVSAAYSVFLKFAKLRELEKGRPL